MDQVGVVKAMQGAVDHGDVTTQKKPEKQKSDAGTRAVDSRAVDNDGMKAFHEKVAALISSISDEASFERVAREQYMNYSDETPPPFPFDRTFVQMYFEYLKEQLKPENEPARTLRELAEKFIMNNFEADEAGEPAAVSSGEKTDQSQTIDKMI